MVNKKVFRSHKHYPTLLKRELDDASFIIIIIYGKKTIIHKEKHLHQRTKPLRL